MPKELTEPTMSGAAISLISMTILMLLLVWHFAKYLTFVNTNDLSIPDP